jgi:hypothetical protein
LATPLSVRDGIEFGTKGVLAFVAAAYVFGLLIVNVRLQWYDIQALGMIRVQYILCGSLFLVLIALGLLAGVISFRMFTLIPSYWRERRIGKALVTIATAVSLPILLIGGTLWQLADYHLYLNEPGLWIASFTVLQLAFATWNIIFGGRLVVSGWHVGPDFRYSQIHSMAIDVSGFLVFLVVYALAVYPRIEPAYGGGRTLTAQIVLKTDAPPELRELLSNLGGKDLAPTLSVLAETEEYLVVENKGAPFQAVAIRKDAMVAVATHPRR